MTLMKETISPLQKKRLEYAPRVPKILKNLKEVSLVPEETSHPKENLRKLFPHTFGQKACRLTKGKGSLKPLKAGVVFSGGQAAGGHNVIAAIFDALMQFDPKSKVIGFLDGPGGIVKNQWREIGKEHVDAVRNQGGFDLIGSGRVKIETGDQLAAALKTVQEHGLDGLVIIGGDDSNTNAAVLAEYFIEKKCKTRVVGVPKTIDGDLRSEDIEVSFGFDTACKTYAELIGNIARDALSAKKYYHFIKLMGRSASHITLECALATRPNLALIGEEKKSLDAIVKEIADLVCRRSEAGKDYGVVLVPEGLIEFMPEMKAMIAELNKLFEKGAQSTAISLDEAAERLMGDSKALFARLPEKIKKQLLLDRDPHGNVQVSQIETEQLLMDLVKKELKKRAEAGKYKGKFSAQEHFLGYEGRAGMPTNFDANYCYALGLIAALAIREGLTGMIGSVQNLTQAPEEWNLKAVPILQLMHLEMRLGTEKPVIEKALVDLEKGAYTRFARARKSWEMEDHYRYPGPIQFFGEPEITDAVPLSLLPS